MPNPLDRFKLERNEGANKVLPLDEAVRRLVRPGMLIHLGECSSGIIREILRQYAGARPGFSLLSSGLRDDAIDMIHCGLVRKIITTAAVETVPSQGPNPVVQRAFKEKKIEIESWSLLSTVQRLMAGAMGLPFMPTHSIMGSTMAEENTESFREVDDPFGSGQRVGLVGAVNPDVSIIHAWAADRNGNAITGLNPFSVGQGEWGVFASKKVLVSVEKIVSTDYIRKHSASVRIPAFVVSAVSVVPFGGHPQGMANVGCGAFTAYGADYEFMEKHRDAARDPAALDRWVKEWTLDCPTQKDFLQKLGDKRLEFLKAKGKVNFWKEDLASASGALSTSAAPNGTERMILVAAERICRIVRDKGYSVLLAGIGLSGLPPWLAYYKLKAQGIDTQLATGSGLLGYSPRPGDPQLVSMANLPTLKSIPGILRTYAVFVAGKHSRCLSIVGAGQIDKHGNINSTRLSPDTFLVGSGGANDAVNATEVMVVAKQSRRRFVDKVPYITCPGARVKTIVSDLGVYEKLGQDDEFTLTGYFGPDASRIAEEAVRQIRDECGWELRVSPNPLRLPEPYREDLAMLRLFDPRGRFISERPA